MLPEGKGTIVFSYPGGQKYTGKKKKTKTGEKKKKKGAVTEEALQSQKSSYPDSLRVAAVANLQQQIRQAPCQKMHCYN